MRLVAFNFSPRNAARIETHPSVTAGYPKNSVSAELGLQYGSQKAETTSIVATPKIKSEIRASARGRNGFPIVDRPSRIPPARGSSRVSVLVQTNDPGALASQQIVRAMTLMAIITNAAATRLRGRLPRTTSGHSR